MKKITRQITITEYVTSDGKVFQENETDKAQIHQDILDGTKKSCDDCNNSGQILEDHGEWGYFEKWISVKCKNCSGKGYLELKWL